MITFLLATTCIMLCCRNFIEDLDENPNNNHWDQILISFFTYIPIIMYFNICLMLIGSGLPNFRPGDPQWRPIWVVIFLMFVSLSGVLFAYLRSVNPEIPDLTFVRDCRETFLVMDAFGLFIFFLATFVNPKVNRQISDRDGGSRGAGGAYFPPDFGRIEGAAGDRQLAASLLAHPDVQTQLHPCDKKAGRTKLVNKVNLRNYASMADTEALIENIGPVYPRPLF